MSQRGQIWGCYEDSQQDFLKEVEQHPALNSLQSCVEKVLGSNFGKEEGARVVERHVQKRRFKGEKVIERRNLKLPQSIRGHRCKAEGEREEGGIRKEKE